MALDPGQPRWASIRNVHDSHSFLIAPLIAVTPIPFVLCLPFAAIQCKTACRTEISAVVIDTVSVAVVTRWKFFCTSLSFYLMTMTMMVIRGLRRNQMVVIHFMSSCLFVFDYKIIYTGQVKRHNTTTVSQKHASTSVITMLPTKSSSRLSTTSTKPPGMQYCQVTFLTFSTTVSFILRFVCGFTFVSCFF